MIAQAYAVNPATEKGQFRSYSWGQQQQRKGTVTPCLHFFSGRGRPASRFPRLQPSLRHQRLCDFPCRSAFGTLFGNGGGAPKAEAQGGSRTPSTQAPQAMQSPARTIVSSPPAPARGISRVGEANVGAPLSQWMQAS